MFEKIFGLFREKDVLTPLYGVFEGTRSGEDDGGDNRKQYQIIIIWLIKEEVLMYYL